MSNWLGRWFGYGLGTAAGEAIFSDNNGKSHTAREPIRQQTEAEIRADERRYDKDEKRLDAQAEAQMIAKKNTAVGT